MLCHWRQTSRKACRQTQRQMGRTPVGRRILFHANGHLQVLGLDICPEQQVSAPPPCMQTVQRGFSKWFCHLLGFASLMVLPLYPLLLTAQQQCWCHIRHTRVPINAAAHYASARVHHKFVKRAQPNNTPPLCSLCCHAKGLPPITYRRLLHCRRHAPCWATARARSTPTLIFRPPPAIHAFMDMRVRDACAFVQQQRLCI